MSERVGVSMHHLFQKIHFWCWDAESGVGKAQWKEGRTQSCFQVNCYCFYFICPTVCVCLCVSYTNGGNPGFCFIEVLVLLFQAGIRGRTAANERKITWAGERKHYVKEENRWKWNRTVWTAFKVEQASCRGGKPFGSLFLIAFCLIPPFRYLMAFAFFLFPSGWKLGRLIRGLIGELLLSSVLVT